MAKSKATPEQLTVPPDAAFSIRFTMATLEQDQTFAAKMQYHDRPRPDVLERVAREKEMAQAKK
jgi:hypothetical protein